MRLTRVVLSASLLAATLVLSGSPSSARVDSTQRAIYKARDKVFPALVHIEPILEVYRSGEKGRMAVTGSGITISPDGYVLTQGRTP